MNDQLSACRLTEEGKQSPSVTPLHVSPWGQERMGSRRSSHVRDFKGFPASVAPSPPERCFCRRKTSSVGISWAAENTRTKLKLAFLGPTESKSLDGWDQGPVL